MRTQNQKMEVVGVNENEKIFTLLKAEKLLRETVTLIDNIYLELDMKRKVEKDGKLVFIELDKEEEQMRIQLKNLSKLLETALTALEKINRNFNDYIIIDNRLHKIISGFINPIVTFSISENEYYYIEFDSDDSIKLVVKLLPEQVEEAIRVAKSNSFLEIDPKKYQIILSHWPFSS